MRNIIHTAFLAGAVIMLSVSVVMAQNYDDSDMDRIQSTYESQNNYQYMPTTDPVTGASEPAEAYSGMEPGAGYPSATMLDTEKIRGLQLLLDTNGYDPGTVDGILGPRTARALRGFQKDNSLAVTGTATDETLVKLGLDTSDRNASDGLANPYGSGESSP